MNHYARILGEYARALTGWRLEQNLPSVFLSEYLSVLSDFTEHVPRSSDSVSPKNGVIGNRVLYATCPVSRQTRHNLPLRDTLPLRLVSNRIAKLLANVTALFLGVVTSLSAVGQQDMKSVTSTF